MMINATALPPQQMPPHHLLTSSSVQKVKNYTFTPKIKFSKEEDLKLRQLVEKFGESDWNQIASMMCGRNGRQCRERWNNYVNPKHMNSPWSEEEDMLLIEKIKEFGPKWQTIATFFPNRAVNNLKNRWNTKQRRLQKQMRKQSSQQTPQSPISLPQSPNQQQMTPNMQQQQSAAQQQQQQPMKNVNDKYIVVVNPKENINSSLENNSYNFYNTYSTMFVNNFFVNQQNISVNNNITTNQKINFVQINTKDDSSSTNMNMNMNMSNSSSNCSTSASSSDSDDSAEKVDMVFGDDIRDICEKLNSATVNTMSKKQDSKNSYEYDDDNEINGKNSKDTLAFIENLQEESSLFWVNDKAISSWVEYGYF